MGGDFGMHLSINGTDQRKRLHRAVMQRLEIGFQKGEQRGRRHLLNAGTTHLHQQLPLPGMESNRFGEDLLGGPALRWVTAPGLQDVVNRTTITLAHRLHQRCRSGIDARGKLLVEINPLHGGQESRQARRESRLCGAKGIQGVEAPDFSPEARHAGRGSGRRDNRKPAVIDRSGTRNGLSLGRCGSGTGPQPPRGSMPGQHGEIPAELIHRDGPFAACMHPIHRPIRRRLAANAPIKLNLAGGFC